MSTILPRCRDAEMLGPVCDCVSGEEPFDQAVKHLRAHAKVHNDRKSPTKTYSSFKTG